MANTTSATLNTHTPQRRWWTWIPAAASHAWWCYRTSRLKNSRPKLSSAKMKRWARAMHSTHTSNASRCCFHVDRVPPWLVISSDCVLDDFVTVCVVRPLMIESSSKPKRVRMTLSGMLSQGAAPSPPASRASNPPRSRVRVVFMTVQRSRKMQLFALPEEIRRKKKFSGNILGRTFKYIVNRTSIY